MNGVETSRERLKLLLLPSVAPCVFSAVSPEMASHTRKQTQKKKQQQQQQKKQQQEEQQQQQQKKKQQGGTRKLGAKAKTWQKSVMEVYRELKKKDSNTMLKDAMKEAAKRKKKGEL